MHLVHEFENHLKKKERDNSEIEHVKRIDRDHNVTFGKYRL